MKSNCNLKVFLNEFNIQIKQKMYCVKSYNGYYDAKSYQKHLKQILNTFKHEILYDLPMVNKGDKEVFLQNIYLELSRKKLSLELIYQKKVQNSIKKECKLSLKHKALKPILKKSQNYRRINYMFHIQIKSLKIALEIIKQTAINYNIDLKTVKPICKRKNIVKWIGGDLEFLQLLHSFINSEKLDTNIASEDEIINEMAQSFGVKITQNTRTSLSRAIHSNNYDYTPKVFDRLLTGYKKFEDHRRKLRGHQLNMG